MAIDGITGRTYMEAAIPGINDTGTSTTPTTVTDPSGTKQFPNLTPAQSAANAKAAGTSTSTTTNGATGTAAGGALGKTEFLQLLVQEMTNQDPLKPADNTEFIAQLAQFSTLEQMQNMNDGFTKLQNTNQASQATSLLSMGEANIPINAVDANGNQVNGLVDKVLINSDGTVQLDVNNGTTVNLSDVLSIGPLPPSGSGSGTGSGGSTGTTGAGPTFPTPAPTNDRQLPGTLVPASESGQ